MNLAFPILGSVSDVEADMRPVSRALTAAVLVCMTAALPAQESQFIFDPNGNLFVQAAAVTAPPQILGQPQNQIVAPGEATSFSVVAADTRTLTYQWRFNGIPLGGS